MIEQYVTIDNLVIVYICFMIIVALVAVYKLF
jgi:hypothetical protein